MMEKSVFNLAFTCQMGVGEGLGAREQVVLGDEAGRHIRPGGTSQI